MKTYKLEVLAEDATGKVEYYGIDSRMPERVRESLGTFEIALKCQDFASQRGLLMKSWALVENV